MKNSYKNFGIAPAAVGSVAAVTLLIPALSDGGMYFLFLTAIIFSTLYGDARAGVFAVVLSMAVNFLLLNYHSKLPQSFGDWLVLLAFASAAGFTVFICHAQVSAEAARRLAESKYRMIFEDAITGIYETTLDGKYAAANPKLAEMFGYQSSEEMIREAENLNRKFYVEPGRRAEFTWLVEEQGNIAGFESEIFRRGGETIWITENAVAVRAENGKLVGFQGTTIEITDRKRAEASLQKAHQELERKVVERTAELERANRVMREEIKERERVENELLASQKQLRELSRHLQFVSEEERKNLARELHDEFGQSMTALKIELVRLGGKLAKGGGAKKAPVKADNQIPAMIEIVDTAMETIRKIVSELRPGVLDELGLAAAMEWQTKEFQKRTGIVCDVRIEFEEPSACIALKTTVFRILQECLTNIARHAAAKRVRISLRDQGWRIFFEVEDDGRGIDLEKIGDSNSQSFGILGMRERALLLNGTVDISRVETGGTRVTVSIPRPAELIKFV